MRNLAKRWRLTALAILLFLGTDGRSYASGCLRSVMTVMSADETDVYTLASAQLSYLCLGTITATVTSPDGSRTTSGGAVLSKGGGKLTVFDSLSVDYEDGTYTGSGIFHYDGSDSGLGVSDLFPKQAALIVPPFIKLTGVSFDSESSVPKQLGTIHFTVAVNTSNSCSGEVHVEADLSTPTDSAIKWIAPSSGNSVTIVQTMARGRQHNFTFTARTDPANMVSGKSVAVGSIMAYPRDCRLVGINNQQTNFDILQ